MESSRISLPPLPPRYEPALRAASEYVFREFDPFAVVVSGSIVRGNPDPASDFDIVVIHRQPWRRRVQKWFDGVPTEIFVNSPEWIESYLKQESAQGRPVMAHMLTTGVLVYSSSPQTDSILEHARESLERGPQFSEAQLEQQRYGAACLYEDAFEIADRDATNAMLILARAVEATVRYWFASRQRFSVRSKEQFQQINLDDPTTGGLIEQTLLAPVLANRIAAAHDLAQHVIGHTGFFEWDSGPGEAAPG
jgi:hypothetical protein